MVAALGAGGNPGLLRGEAVTVVRHEHPEGTIEVSGAELDNAEER
jgi:hypothetical protein